MIICFLNHIDTKIVFAFEMFRHGARAPMKIVDGLDLFGQEWVKVEDLTAVGYRQQYLLGVRNREKYITETKLLSSSFDYRELYVISTTTDRTFRSASAQLQGLYPEGTGPLLINEWQIDHAIPQKDQSTFINEKKALDNKALPQQIDIIPIHSFFKGDKDFQLYGSAFCPGVQKYHEANKKREELRAIIMSFSQKYGKEICELLKKKNSQCLEDFSLINNVIDTLISEYTDDRDMSIFTNKGIDVEEMINDCHSYFTMAFLGNGIDFDKSIGLVSMSFTMKKIISWMEGIQQKKRKDSVPKMVMYSAHDSSIGAFEAFMKAAFDYEIIYGDYAANLFMELHVNDVLVPTIDDYTVKYIFNDNEISSMPFKEFKKIIEENVWDDKQINDFCKFIEKNKPSFNYWIIPSVILGLINIVIIGFMIFLCLRKSDERIYHSIEKDINSPL